jgi:hypothetical protein
MASEVNITHSLGTRWREVEADGQLCVQCGERIYLYRAWLLGLFFGDTEIAINERYFICDSCHDFLQERGAAGREEDFTEDSEGSEDRNRR